MPEFLEPVAVPSPPKSHSKGSCPFCKDKKEDDEKLKSKLGADNASSKLASSLAGVGESRKDVGFEHDDYGSYSAEPHHLVPGNEAMKGHDIEKWLGTKASGTKVLADTGFDINSARNGKWIPSITDANRICNWDTVVIKKDPVTGKAIKRKRFPSAADKDKKMWGKLDNGEKNDIAFAIMIKESLQFHKSNHLDKGATDSQCYIKETKRLLNELNAYANKASTLNCPEVAAKKKGDKFPPPYYLGEMIYACASSHMGWHVGGSPESWFVFISAISCLLFQKVVKEGMKPWTVPYEGHPDRS